MKVCVFGGSGSIGSELVRQHAQDGDTVTIFDNNEPIAYDFWEKLNQEGHDVKVIIGDIRNERDIRQVGKQDLVYVAAAQKVVTAMEWFPRQSIDINIVGTMNVLEAMKGTRTVFISTDKAAKADCVMGASKRLMEIVARNMGAVIVRFGNVMNSRGSVIPLWKNQIEEGKPITITDRRCKRFLMTIPEAVHLVRTAAGLGKPGQTWIMDMGLPVSISRLADRIIEECGKDPRTYPIKEIGLRDGEVFEEMLMTDEEKAKSVKKNGFYVIS